MNSLESRAPYQPNDELWRLVGALCDGTLTAAERDRLEELLSQDAAARQYCIAYLDMHAQILWRYRESAADRPAVAPAAAVDAALPVSVLRVVSRATSALRRPILWATLAASVLFAGYVAVISWGMLDKGARGLRLESHRKQSPAYIAASENAQWQKQPQAGPPAASAASQPAITQGESLELASGVVQLKLKQGVTLLVEGPAEWSIDGKNLTTLKRGKLLASVPQQAIGFTVVTPTSKIVDLGTEFGVTVNVQGQTHTQVFRGEVEVKSGAANAAETRRSPDMRRLVAGEAVRIDARGSITAIEPMAEEPEQFISPTRVAVQPTGMAEADLADAYSQAVLQTPGLVAYWRLADGGRPEVKDEVGVTQQQPLGRSPGKYLGFRGDSLDQPGALSAGKSGAVYFDGRSCVEIPAQPHLSGDWDGLTLAAWIKPGRVQPQENDVSMIVGNWARQVSSDTYCLSYRDGHLYLAVGNGVNVQTSLIGVGNVPLTFDAYHFVVGTWQKRDGSYRLYVDGEADLARLQQTPPWKLHAGATHSVSIGGQRITADRQFVGAIDEVSIFSRALSAEEIQQLYRQAHDDKQDQETKAHE